MAKEILFLFFVGGAVVAAFSCLGDLFKPKSFAGLFGAAPSVALATLALTIATEGKRYGAIEARSMIAGAAAFLVYSICVTQGLFRYKLPALLVSSLSLTVWLATALGLWAMLLR